MKNKTPKMPLPECVEDCAASAVREPGTGLCLNCRHYKAALANLDDHKDEHEKRNAKALNAICFIRLRMGRRRKEDKRAHAIMEMLEDILKGVDGI